MPTRIKQDRSRASGHKHSVFIQDMPAKPVDPVALITTNLRTARNILKGNMQRYGDRLPAGLRSQVAVVVKNMESIVKGQSR